MALLLRTIIAISILYLIGANVSPSTFSTVPLLVWSGDNYFASGSHNPELISNEQLETLFQQVTGLKSQDTNTAIEFVKTTPPEVVVVFVENKLRTDQFSQFVRQGQREHQTFNRLRNAFKSSKSSASCPYVLASEYLPLSDVISQITNDLLQSSPTSSVYIVNDESESNAQTQSGVNSRTLLQFLEEISLGNPIFTNGVTDFVAIYFSPKEENTLATSLSEDDSYIGTVHQIINKETNGNYIAVFTADTPQEKSILRVRAVPEENIEFTSTVSNFFQKYFPMQLTMALFASALLILILVIGVWSTMSIQSPQKFETPRVRRAEN